MLLRVDHTNLLGAAWTREATLRAHKEVVGEVLLLQSDVALPLASSVQAVDAQARDLSLDEDRRQQRVATEIATPRRTSLRVNLLDAGGAEEVAWQREEGEEGPT